MKKVWVISLCLILLFGAWFFRWEQGPTQTADGLKIVHRRDRWVNQQWVQFYGSYGDNFYSGESAPHFSDGEINAKAKEILSGPIGQKRKKDLQAKMNEAVENKEEVSKGHTQYIRLFEQYKEEFDEKYVKPQAANEFEEDMAYLDAWGSGLDLERTEYASNRMPEKLRADSNAWKKYDKLENQYWHQLHNIDLWAANEAEKQLIARARFYRKTTTYIWFIILSIVILSAIIHNFMTRKRVRLSTIASTNLSSNIKQGEAYKIEKI